MPRRAVTPALLACAMAAPWAARADDVAASRWGQVPTKEEIAAAYPKAALEAGVEGSSSMTCTANRVGLLESCTVQSESPADAGFGAAELKLVQYFRLVPPVVGGHLQPIGQVTIPMNWTIAATKGYPPQAWAPATPKQGPGVPITWRRLPHGADINFSYPTNAYEARLPGWATVSCRATAKGLLRECAVVEENPPGNGFGEAAQRMAAVYFQLDPMAADGSSVEGLKVTLKLSWAMTGVQYFYSRTGER